MPNYWLPRRAHFGNYNPASFGWGGKFDPRNNHDLLVPFVHDGVNYGLMHRDVVNLFHNVFQDLYPHIKGGVTPGDDGCYNDRSISGGGSRSFHSWAIATDTNWRDNPMGVIPADPHGRHVLPPITHAIVHRWGCEWGGDWTSPHDFMHIECHLSPQVARRVRRRSQRTREFRK